MTEIIFAFSCWTFWGCFAFRFYRSVSAGADVFAEFADLSVRTMLFFVLLATFRQLFCLLGLPVFLMGLASGGLTLAAVGINRDIIIKGSHRLDRTQTITQAVILSGMMGAICLPIAWYLFYNGLAATPNLYLYTDQPWHFSHGLALMKKCVPDDLSFCCKPTRYHVGFGAIASLLAKMFFIPLGPAYYILASALFRMWIIAGFVMVALRPGGVDHRSNYIAMSLAVASFVLYFDVDIGLALYWLAFSRDVSLLPGYEPYMQPQLFMLNGMVGAELLVFSLFIPFAGLLIHKRYYIAAPLLGYASFVRPQGFLSFAIAYALYAIWRLVAKKETAPFLAGLVALGMTLFFQIFGMLRIEGFSVLIGKGYGFQYFTHIPVIVSYLWDGFGLPTGGVYKFVGTLMSLLFRVSTLFVFLATAIYLLRFCSPRRVSELWSIFSPHGYTLLVIFFLYLLPFIIVFKAGEELDRLYQEILGVTYSQTYTRAGFSVHSLRIGQSLLVLMGSLIMYETYCKYPAWQKRLAICCVAVMATMYALGFARPPAYYSEMVDVKKVKEVLSAAPLDSVIATNQHAYPVEDNRRKYRNVLYPALFGHQFYASNFVYNNLHTKQDRRRLEDMKWFWDRRFDMENVAFLKERKIGYLFINRKFPNNIPDNLVDFYLSEVASNKEYRLIKVN